MRESSKDIDMTTGSYWHLDVCLSTRANLLLIGPDDITRGFLKAVRPHLQEPVAILRGGESFALPPGPVGTLILINVGGFSPPDQDRLCDALIDRLSGAQVISTSATGLMPMLAARSFLETLYYRLNTIYIDVAAALSDAPFTTSRRARLTDVPWPVTRN
jgi:hypothetical protein